MPLNAEVISLESLLARYPSFDVPNYQRTFKWTEELITNLFQDILNGLDFTTGSDPRGHFLGSIVVCKDEATGKLDLVDGQQRLTTLTILLWSLAKLADPETLEKAKRTIRQSDLINPRIMHMAGNDAICSDRAAYREVAINMEPDFSPNGDAYEEEVVEENATWATSLQSTQLFKAGRCLDKLAKRACDAYVRENQTSNTRLAAAIIYKRIAEGVRLIIIETDQRKEGMRVFASINAGGTKLEPWELIKSAFFTHGTSEQQQLQVQMTFDHDRLSIKRMLGLKNDDSGINNGLRTIWLATRKFARMDDLFNEFNDALTQSKDPARTHSDLLKIILFSAPLIKGLDNGSKDVMTITKKRYDLSSAYPVSVVMRDKVARPILLSVLLRLQQDPSKAEDALRRVSFALERARMKLIVTKSGGNFIEKPYSQLANEIYRGKHSDDPETMERSVYDYLRSIEGFPDRFEFEEAFKRHNIFGRDQKLPRLIASRMQAALRNPKKIHQLYLQSASDDEGVINAKKGLIIPDDMDTDDEAIQMGFISLANLKQCTNSLGNMFLADVETGEIDPGVALNGGIENPGAMDENAIKSRCSTLAELATNIWNF
jgi:hypothetical protein